VRECELQAVLPSLSFIVTAFNNIFTSWDSEPQVEYNISAYRQRTLLPHPPCLDHQSLSRTTSRRTKCGKRPTLCGVIVLWRCPARHHMFRSVIIGARRLELLPLSYPSLEQTTRLAIIALEAIKCNVAAYINPAWAIQKMDEVCSFHRKKTNRLMKLAMS